MSEILSIRKRAHEYAQAGDLDNALEEYRKLLTGDDVDPNIYNLMGDIHFKKGDEQSAFRQYEEAVRKYRCLPQNAQTQPRLHRCFPAAG